MDRVAASEHSSDAKQRINDAIATIGRTNNRQHANEVRNNVVQSLASTRQRQPGSLIKSWTRWSHRSGTLRRKPQRAAQSPVGPT
jgi:hypothetical protein